MGRPETISCQRCGATVAVKAKGPVPKYCAGCRRKPSRNGHGRPTSIQCERCGGDVVVSERGPLPRFCHGGCPRPRLDTQGIPVMAEAFAGSAAPPTPRRSGIAGTLRPRSQAAPPGAGVFDGPALRPAPAQAVVSHAVVTRLDAIATSTDRRTWERRAQVQRVKRLVAIAAWLAFVAAVILILFIGSRPSPPDFYSWSRTLV